MRLSPDRSPCRPHPCSVEHADTVWVFRDMQREWATRAESVTGGHTTELSRFIEDNPRPTFRDFLTKRGKQQ